MKYALILSVLLSQLSSAYEYSERNKKNIIIGCFKSGASKEFCICQLEALQKTIPESKLTRFQNSLSRLYAGGSPSILSNNEVKSMKEMAKCVGL